MRVIPGDLGFC